MTEPPGTTRQLPCPDCGSPVNPDRDQLCASCGYPLMFLRRVAEEDARAVPRAPGEQPGAEPPRSASLPSVPVVAYGQVPCPQCGYGNEPVRIRCERCGHELRRARPDPVALDEPVPPPAPRRRDWAVALIVMAMLAALILAFVLL